MRPAALDIATQDQDQLLQVMEDGTAFQSIFDDLAEHKEELAAHKAADG